MVISNLPLAYFVCVLWSLIIKIDYVLFYQQFYIIESNLEVLGRHMLFLSLIMEPPDQLGYQG